MSIGEAIRDAIELNHSFGMGADLALDRHPEGVTAWVLKAHSDALGTSVQSIAGPFTGTLSHPSVASPLGIASSSADDASGGTGARTVRVTGLNTSYDVATEDVALTGQTKVTTVGSFIAVHGLAVLTAGSGGMNAGTIYVADDGDTFTAGVPTAPYMLMDAGWNVAAPGVYMVPDDYELGLSRISISGDNGKTVTVYFEVLNGAGLWERRVEIHLGSGAGEFTLLESALVARGRVRVRGFVSTGTGQIMVMVLGVLRAVPA